MGTQKCFYPVFLCVIIIVWCIQCLDCVSTQKDDAESVCNLRGCNCTNAAPAWKNVNCTFDNAQSVELTARSIPGNVLEFFVSGGKDLVLYQQTFTSLQGLALIRIDGTQNVLVKKHSFYNVTSPSLLVQIQNCERLVIEMSAFKNMQSSIEIEISRVAHVKIEKSAFSRLHNGKFKDIGRLELSESTFEFENQGNIGRHGPVTILSFCSVMIPVIPRAAFFSSLAEINIESSDVHDIHTEAFKASQISAVLLMNSSIHCIRTGAFNERTQIYNFMISKCNISLLQARAIMAAISNLTVQHSRITDIQTGAINSTVANTIISDNEVGHFRTACFSLNDWNKVNMDNNIIKHLHPDFLEVPPNPNTDEFTFTENDVYFVDPGALSFIHPLMGVLKFENNFFNETCHCDINKWLEDIFRSKDVFFAMDTSYCMVTGLLSRCFELKEGLINMQNFTELACKEGDTIVCEPYMGDTKILDTTSKMLLDDNDENRSSGLILGLTLGALLILAISGTIVILLIRGGLWLKRKGYFRNIRYNGNESSNDDENTIVTVDRNDKLDLPEELTPELLQMLRDRLENPQTHDEAREMIERLYEAFIVDESYTNNNRQEEEAHLYEELGNMQAPHLQRNSSEPDKLDGPSDDAISFLRLIEERFSRHAGEAEQNARPALVGEYSEPTDAAVHLYSELRQNKPEDYSESEKKGSVKSSGSTNMAFRPLPDKPPHDESVQPGPSSKP